jgi:hypothetical protein
MTSVDKKFQDPDFSWDTLKRDEILMMPLIDMRRSNEPEFFDDKTRIALAEEFKQSFFKRRKDIHMYGQGGAFEAMIEAEKLSEIQKRMILREDLSTDDKNVLTRKTQDIRFFMSWAIDRESLDRDFHFEEPLKVRYAIKTYTSRRLLNLVVSLWDSKKNKVVWSVEKKLQIENTRTFRVPRRYIPKDAEPMTSSFDANDSPFENHNLATELANRPNRFPNIPDRHDVLQTGYDDVTLALPIQSSEEKLIVYESFTHHRPEIGFGVTSTKNKSVIEGYLGTSSVTHNHFRLGFVLAPTSSSANTTYLGHKFELRQMYGGITTALEYSYGAFDFDGGILAGFIGRNAYSDDIDLKENTYSETWAALWPFMRLYYHLSPQFCAHLGATYRYQGKAKEEIFKEVTSAPYAIDTGLSFTIKGF